MRFQAEKNIKVTSRSAAHPRLALACQPDARAILNAGRHIDRQRAVPRDAARAKAGLAGVVDDLATALAGGANPFNGEESLLRPHPAMARTGGTCLGL